CVTTLHSNTETLSRLFFTHQLVISRSSYGLKNVLLHVEIFIQLCMEKYYDGTIFHRLVKDYIIQGGDPTGTGQGGESIYGKPFKDEFHQRLRFNRRGLVGMANAGKDDNGSQFFFTVGNDVRELDKKHTLFGKIVGNTVFNMLKMTECDVDENERPRTIHKIRNVTILTNPFTDMQPRHEEDAERDASYGVEYTSEVRSKKEEVDDDGKDEDFEKMIDDERRKQERERMEAMQAELKAMQKEHIKALRGPKQKTKEEGMEIDYHQSCGFIS
ncbi:peptidyl-prolyl cis-trans isomerase, cyclophilin-type, partial [Cooperia oncophora]